MNALLLCLTYIYLVIDINIYFFHVFIMWLSSLTPEILFLTKGVSKGGYRICIFSLESYNPNLLP